MSEEGTKTDETLENQTPTEEVPKETAEEEEVEFNPKEVLKKINDMSSEIGRGGKALHEVQLMRQEIASLKELLENQSQKATETSDAEDFIATASDVKRIISQAEQEKQKAFAKYNDSYLNSLAKLSVEEGLEDDQIAELDKILTTSIKGSKSNYKDPAIDAEINFHKALRILEKSSKKTVNLKGDTPKGTKVGAGSDNLEKEVTMPKLSPEAQDFVNWAGMKPDEVVKALK